MEIKVGIIGCGLITEWAHLPVLTGPDIYVPEKYELDSYTPYEKQEEPPYIIKIIALCDLKEDRLNRLGDRYNISRRYTDYQQMLNNEHLDALIIAAGHLLNVEIIPQAIQRGLNVFVEKPLSGTLIEALRLKSILNSSKKVFQVGFMRRFSYGYRTAKRILSNQFGQIETLNARFWSGDKEDLLNNGIHIFDISQFLVEAPVKQVFAESKGQNIIVLVKFDTGNIGCLSLIGEKTGVVPRTWHSVHERVELTGTKNNTVVVENNKRVYLYENGNPAKIFEPPQILHWITSYNLSGFAGEYRHFFNCIQLGEDSSVGVESGIYSIRLKEGIEKSLKEGRIIDLDEYQNSLLPSI